jgi:hypothetical protein
MDSRRLHAKAAWVSRKRLFLLEILGFLGFRQAAPSTAGCQAPRQVGIHLCSTESASDMKLNLMSAS